MHLERKPDWRWLCWFVTSCNGFHEVSNSEVVLKEFDKILKPSGRLAIVEVTKKSTFAFAPIQNPEK